MLGCFVLELELLEDVCLLVFFGHGAMNCAEAAAAKGFLSFEKFPFKRITFCYAHISKVFWLFCNYKRSALLVYQFLQGLHEQINHINKLI